MLHCAAQHVRMQCTLPRCRPLTNCTTDAQPLISASIPRMIPSSSNTRCGTHSSLCNSCSCEYSVDIIEASAWTRSVSRSDLQARKIFMHAIIIRFESIDFAVSCYLKYHELSVLFRYSFGYISLPPPRCVLALKGRSWDEIFVSVNNKVTDHSYSPEDSGGKKSTSCTWRHWAILGGDTAVRSTRSVTTTRIVRPVIGERSQ